MPHRGPKFMDPFVLHLLLRVCLAKTRRPPIWASWLMMPWHGWYTGSGISLVYLWIIHTVVANHYVLLTFREGKMEQKQSLWLFEFLLENSALCGHFFANEAHCVVCLCKVCICVLAVFDVSLYYLAWNMFRSGRLKRFWLKFGILKKSTQSYTKFCIL